MKQKFQSSGWKKFLFQKYSAKSSLSSLKKKVLPKVVKFPLTLAKCLSGKLMLNTISHTTYLCNVFREAIKKKGENNYKINL